MIDITFQISFTLEELTMIVTPLLWPSVRVKLNT